MATAVNGGDEVSALVLDIGGSTTRAGYAGDDTPKAIFPTYYGYTIDDVPAVENQTDATDANGAEVHPRKKLNIHLGEQTGPSTWRAGMEIANPVRESLITDFDPIPAIINHALRDSLRTDPTEHPILVTEPPWNTPANRERMAEIMFEEFHVPAFYIANSAVLNAFSAGKGTALVIDVGKDTASVTPVVDGFVLRKGMTRSTIPQLVYANAVHLLTQPQPPHRGPIQLWSHHLIGNKAVVGLNKPPSFTLREDRIRATTESWRQWAEQREVDEWLAGVAGVLEHGFNEHAANQRPPRSYEFPTGFNTLFRPERYLPGELYFTHQHLQRPNLPQTIPQLLNTSLMSCEADLRSLLLSNVVVNGGGSLLVGFLDRLHNELVRHYTTIKVHAAGHITERRYGAWLGGSILASLGTFHQLWISAEEWQEHGRAIVGQRCK